MNEKKKKIIAVFVVLAVIAVIAIIIENTAGNKTDENSFWNNDPGVFYPVDYTLNIMEYEDYLQLDRIMVYSDSGITTRVVTAEDAAKTDSYALFFYSYFDSMIKGEYTYFRGYYTEVLRKKHEIPYEFTQQQIYNMDVTHLSTSRDGDKIISTFKVIFSIHENNGTLWKNLASDRTRPLIFTLVETGDDVDIKINDIEWLQKAQ